MCCRCNGSGRCHNCSRVKKGIQCTNCLPLRRDRCQNTADDSSSAIHSVINADTCPNANAANVNNLRSSQLVENDGLRSFEFIDNAEQEIGSLPDNEIVSLPDHEVPALESIQDLPVLRDLPDNQFINAPPGGSNGQNMEYEDPLPLPRCSVPNFKWGPWMVGYSAI